MAQSMAVKKNDNVVVIAGRDRGKRGRVLRVLPETRRVIVEGVNFVKRHTKPNPQRNVKGGIVERESSLSASNVQVVCPECGAPTRVGRRVDRGTSGTHKVRICRKCNGVMDK
jgi:large subunit ribosomal protein L24